MPHPQILEQFDRGGEAPLLQQGDRAIVGRRAVAVISGPRNQRKRREQERQEAGWHRIYFFRSRRHSIRGFAGVAWRLKVPFPWLALRCSRGPDGALGPGRSEEHTSELQSLRHLVCRLLLEKK